MKRQSIVIGLILLAAVAGGIVTGLLVFNSGDGDAVRPLDGVRTQFTGTDGDAGPLEASGFIEAEEIDIAAEIGGRVDTLPFAEGDDVMAGDVLVQLDTQLLHAQRDAAQAQVTITQAERALLARGVREEAIAQAEAQVAIAQAAVDAAAVALQGAVSIRNNPQNIELQVIEAQTQVEAAQHQVNAANAGLALMERWQDLYDITFETFDRIREQQKENAPDLWVPFEFALIPQQRQNAAEQLATAQEALNGAQNLLQTVQQMAQSPQQLQAQVVEAQSALDEAQARLTQSQAQLAELRTGPTEEQLGMADARIAEAEAARAALDTRISRMTLTAPVDGVILEQTVHVGELAAPTVPIVTLANLNTVELTVYIEADRFDQVALNQPVEVFVDSFPGRAFTGTVVYIADEAEFTPRNVQTREERVNLVYAVTVRIENTDHALKPGMPADARF